MSETPESSPAVEVRDLRKSYSSKQGDISALNGLSFEVAPGEIFGLIGPNGAGKTTLIGCLLGLLRPDAGTVRIFSKPADCMSVRRITGYVPERSDFEHWMTARQFLEYHHGLAGLHRGTMEGDIDMALETVQLARACWNRRLKTYSRGMLQRLNLAQLIIGRPRLALLDEPTLGLDPTGVAVARNVITRMRESGVTAIINSHQLDEIERLCDRVAFINKGTIASIETLKAGSLTDYMLFVRWNEHALNGNFEAALATAAEASSSVLEDFKLEWGRFRVQDSRSAASLVKGLIEAGLPVEEAVPERLRLEQLFAGVGDDTVDGGAIQ